LGVCGPTATVTELTRRPYRLVELWRPDDGVAVVDAVRPGAPPGTVHVLDAAAAPLPTALAAGSTHGIGLGTAFELALSLDRLPARLMVYGIEGCRGADGAGLSPAVSAAADRVVAALVNESGAAARR